MTLRDLLLTTVSNQHVKVAAGHYEIIVAEGLPVDLLNEKSIKDCMMTDIIKISVDKGSGDLVALYYK